MPDNNDPIEMTPQPPIADSAGVSSLTQSAAMERFILHWGDLGPNWGVNRSVAQVHALLFVADAPMNAADIADALSMARSNVHNSLKELLGWALIRKAPMAGDRRDHFIAEGDVWEMATRIAEIRKAREIDPAAAILKSCLADARNDPKANPKAVERLDALLDLIDVSNSWFDQMRRVPRARLLPLLRLGSKAVDLLSPFLSRKNDREDKDTTDRNDIA